jgi:hypothetical protein
MDETIETMEMFFDQDFNVLFEKEANSQWRHWTRNPGHRATRPQEYRRTNHTTTEIPHTSKPTTAVTNNTIKRTQGTSTQAPEPPKPNAYWWYEIIDAPDNIRPTLQGLKDGTALWVADGSFKDAQGSAAFILLPSIEAETGITLVNQTPG